ncbi:MAG: twin-arginine translocase subunit TatB [Gammaproteobacteria bacterium HGW-Gammaproteobacteria-3]|jgi:sec-independent protein translocase protein TatB|nr:MAG: twin-arginine translocase subunit TatB [Gammaproteobacteria bacterium HGW-Gammaproteobacteria-3]
MFDIGFWEICMVGLVSLLVIGPERLPKAARIAGFWLGKTRNMVASVKAEIKEELQAEEIRQILKEQAALEDLQEAADDANNAVHDLASSFAEPAEQNSQKNRSDDAK